MCFPFIVMHWLRAVFQKCTIWQCSGVYCTHLGTTWRSRWWYLHKERKRVTVTQDSFASWFISIKKRWFGCQEVSACSRNFISLFVSFEMIQIHWIHSHCPCSFFFHLVADLLPCWLSPNVSELYDTMFFQEDEKCCLERFSCIGRIGPWKPEKIWKNTVSYFKQDSVV